jgi:hypothetical protein
MPGENLLPYLGAEFISPGGTHYLLSVASYAITLHWVVMSDASTQSVARVPQKCETDYLVTSVQKIQNVNVCSSGGQLFPNKFFDILYTSFGFMIICCRYEPSWEANHLGYITWSRIIHYFPSYFVKHPLAVCKCVSNKVVGLEWDCILSCTIFLLMIFVINLIKFNLAFIYIGIISDR